MTTEQRSECISILRFYLCKFRKRLLIALICLIVSAVFSLRFLPDAIVGYADIIRWNATATTEAVVTSVAECEESFHLFNGERYLVTQNNRAINCDLLMAREKADYHDNAFLFSGKLALGECAVSENLMHQYDLHIGDCLYVRKTDSTFVITETLAAQAGIDKKYQHEGVVILAFDDSLLSPTTPYLSMPVSGDRYTNLQSIVFFENEADDAQSTVIQSILSFVAVFAVTVAICEALIDRRRYRDYRLIADDGTSPGRLLLQILSDLGVRYFIPTVILCIAYAVRWGYYGKGCYISLLLYLGAVLLLLMAAANIICRRIFVCRMKKTKMA